MERAGDSLTATVAAAVADSASPGDALGAGVRAFFAFLDSDRAAWAVLFDETLPRGGEVAERVADYRGAIVALVSGSLLAQLPQARATPPGSRSRPSPPPCSAPPRRSPAGGCGPRRSPPTKPPSY